MKKLKKKRHYWYILSFLILFGMFGNLHIIYTYLVLSINSILIYTFEINQKLKQRLNNE